MQGPTSPEPLQDPDGPANLGASGSLPRDATALTKQPARQLLGVNLEPVLRKACQSRLSRVNWFRTDWQRGGALTGQATYKDDSGTEQPVVVKLPVPPGERFWLTRLSCEQDVVPFVYAHGDILNGYDMAWVILERLPHGPLGSDWGGRAFDLLIEALGRFYAITTKDPPPNSSSIERPDWQGLLERSRKNVQERGLANGRRWNKALKQAQRRLGPWLSIWDDRPVEDWCHGDVHLANAMTREPAPNGPAVLLDFALTHPGHWLEDAVYFEHLYWARPPLLGDRRLCRQVAHERRRLGLRVEEDWARLADIRRALVAMSTPADLAVEGHPRQVQAALELLEAQVR